MLDGPKPSVKIEAYLFRYLENYQLNDLGKNYYIVKDIEGSEVCY